MTTFYIWACRRDDLTRHYWNRRKRLWQTNLTASCLYPTARGVDRIWQYKSTFFRPEDRKFHEIGWKSISPA